MAVRAVHTSGSFASDVIVNGTNLGAPDTVHTTIAAAYAASSSGDWIVLCQDAEFNESIFWTIDIKFAAHDDYRHAGDYSGGRVTYSTTTRHVAIRADVEIINVAFRYTVTAFNGIAFSVAAQGNAAYSLLLSGVYVHAPGSAYGIFCAFENTAQANTLTVENSAFFSDSADWRNCVFVDSRSFAHTAELLNVSFVCEATVARNGFGVEYVAGGIGTAEVVNCKMFEGPNNTQLSFTGYNAGVTAHSSYPTGDNAASDASSPGTNTYDNKVAIDVFSDPANGDLHWKDLATMQLYTGSDVSSDMVYDFDVDGESRTGTWYIGADLIIVEEEPVEPTDPEELINNAISSVFQGNAKTLRTSYDRWTHDGNAAGGINHQRRPTVAVRNDASTRLGVNAEPKFVTIVESPVLYVGMGDGSVDQEITSQQFVPDKTGIILEYRYGVDRKMREATPFMSAFEGNQKNLYTLDSFPVEQAAKNWQSTTPSSFRLSASNDDAEGARAVPASGNQDKIYEQQELAEYVAAYETHPQEPKLREIKYITYDSANDYFLGTAITTEQRRRLPSSDYQGSNYTETETEISSLYTVNKSTSVVTKVADYNGSFWDSALIKQIHLLMFDQNSLGLYGIMPPGSHQQYLDTAEDTGVDHIGTVVAIDTSTAEVTEVGALYWTPGTDSLQQVEIKNINYDPYDNRALVLLRTKSTGDPFAVGHVIRELNTGTPAISTSVHSFGDVTYSNENVIKSNSYPRAFAMRSSGQSYVMMSKGIGEMHNPKRHLHAVDFSLDGLGTEIGIARQTSMDSIASDGSDYYAIDTDRHELVQVHENFNQSGIFEREMGALVVDVFDTGATDEVVYTRLNVDNARAMDYHDIMVVTLEASEIGELLQIEFGSSVSKIDGRSPVISEPGKQPDLQVQKVNFRKADKQVDVYININGSTFGGATRDEMRYIGFRIKDARTPFTFKVSRIQLMKLDPDTTPQIYAPNTFLEANKQFVQFSSNDRRRVRWFVQIRAILLTQIPPISPRLKDAVIHADQDLAVINHPHRRLRGGRTVTPHLNDTTLGMQNEGYSQAPAKINGAYISDGYGVDPNSEPTRDPDLYFGS